MSYLDQVALDAATVIMSAVRGRALPGGDVQLKACIQCTVRDALARCAPVLTDEQILDELQGDMWDHLRNSDKRDLLDSIKTLFAVWRR